MLKICSKCGVEKDAETEFYRGRGRYKTCCLEQQKNYSKANREKTKKRNREYVVKNRDSIRNRQREYLVENRERINKRHRDYYQKNKESILEHFKKNAQKTLIKSEKGKGLIGLRTKKK